MKVLKLTTVAALLAMAFSSTTYAENLVGEFTSKQNNTFSFTSGYHGKLNQSITWKDEYDNVTFEYVSKDTDLVTSPKNPDEYQLIGVRFQEQNIVLNIKDTLTVALENQVSPALLTEKNKGSLTYGIVARNAGTVDISAKEIDVNVLGNQSTGVLAHMKNAVLNLKAEDIHIKASTDTNTIPFASAVTALQGGKVSISATNSILLDARTKDGNLGNAISVRGDSTVTINAEGNRNTTINGFISHAAAGDDAKGTINVTLVGKDSSWTGNTMLQWDESSNGKDIQPGPGISLTLEDGATWNIVHADSIEPNDNANAESYVGMTDLTLNQGVVNLNENDTIEVKELAGTGGTLNVKVDSETLEHGSLQIENIQSSTSAPQFAMNLQGVTADDLTPEQAQAISQNIVQETTGDNTTTQPATGIETTTNVAEGMYNGGMTLETSADGTVAPVKVATNTLMQDTMDLASSSTLAMNRILMNDVRKRLGDLRATTTDNGVWARYEGGKLSGEAGLDSDFNTIQFGADTKLGNDWRVGVAANYTKGETDYNRGSADMDAYSLAAYGVWMADNGMFADVIARVAKMDTDMTVDATKKGTLKNFSASLSGEFGWRFEMNDMFFVEPQAELSYTYVNSDTLKLGNAASYELDSVDSLIGRAGVVFGMQCPSDMGNVYVRVSGVHEFLGDAAITGANGTTHEVDGKDSWVEFGIGANINIAKNSYVWLDVERTDGATLDEDWRANVGVRYAF